MIRSSFIFAAVLALLASQAHADEDQGSPRLFGLILTLKSWPPHDETAALIRRKLEEAGLEETDMSERFRTWFFRLDESVGPSITEPPREFRRLFCVSHAASAVCSVWR